MPPWNHRRRLVYASWALGCLMVLVGAVGYLKGEATVGVAGALITSGTAIITVPLTAYVTFATFDDKWHFTPEDDHDPE